ncbi:DUF1552 domain-containing protein [Sorangium cellulosum]|uniref:DUF1552 domain-containing protein n=1 Tax=Sorangium cellulosum So0157-2 TaxID=1254432 RepID=S4XNA1_SORCE|nr:DUF1552 domain-containing protein [Sorangium cellulosum]AGP33240.1 hypothetical protein SCE1572_01205 [Sorangium cellulosum So0157-2]
MLRGAGAIAVALPWLEIMGTERLARAQPAPARRFLAVYTPGGTLMDRWRPTGTETSFTLGPILAPLAPVQDRLLVVDGLDMKSARGEQHQAGIIAWLTGTSQEGASNGGYGRGPSIDQVIASRISAGRKAKASLQLAVRWATGKSHGLMSPMNVVNFEDTAPHSPIPPRLDPVEIFAELFGTLNPGASDDAALRLARKRSILDFLDGRYAALSARLGAADRQKIDQHLTKIRELEQSLGSTPAATSACRVPTRVDTSDYNPSAGLNSDDPGSIKDTSTDAAIPKVGKLLTDMMVMALACDITAVGTLQWSDTEAKYTLPWLNLAEHHHFYQEMGGFRPTECELIYTWYSEQHLYLLQEMEKVDMGGRSLLDESVVFFGSEISHPPTHAKTNMPFLLAGGGGGLRTGRWVRYPNLPHNNLLVSILNLFGDTRTRFGAPAYCTGPLTNLM